MVFRIIVGILSILVAALIIFLMTGLPSEQLEAFSEMGITWIYIIPALLLVASGILGIFLRKNKICRIVSPGLLLVGSLITATYFIWANVAANMVNMDFYELYPLYIGELIGISGLATIGTGILSIILLILSFKKPKAATN
ncbi:MAG: hypothetical protein FWG89_04640 [Treponema sp.]|nr:hypothetical protein [Treponema sp.]